jgi:hypothetical protein
MPTTRTYRWEGGDLVMVDRYVMERITLMDRELEVGDVFSLGPWRLRVLDFDHMMQRYLVMRDGWRSIVRSWVIQGAKPLDRSYRRLILTAHVWGWAKVPQGAVPCRQHLRPPWKRSTR